MEIKKLQQVKRKVPKYNHIRRKLYEKHTPDVNLELAYKNKESNEITIINDTVTPKSRFPPDQYEKIYEIATVKVII